jgi:hypothetical protein
LAGGSPEYTIQVIENQHLIEQVPAEADPALIRF